MGPSKSNLINDLRQCAASRFFTLTECGQPLALVGVLAMLRTRPSGACGRRLRTASAYLVLLEGRDEDAFGTPAGSNLARLALRIDRGRSRRSSTSNASASNA